MILQSSEFVSAVLKSRSMSKDKLMLLQMTKRYELDFRERAGRMGYKMQTSVKNFQMATSARVVNKLKSTPCIVFGV
uniref:Uncharacterized protein n=1 Tax=Arundo donax TaxID=35708 RepID=A0A0A8YUZ5_ARUDO